MSTYYESKLLVGNYISEVGKEWTGDRESLSEYLQDEGMYHIENCDWVGFEIEEDETVFTLNLCLINKVNATARKFEEITGVQAKAKACVYSY